MYQETDLSLEGRLESVEIVRKRNENMGLGLLTMPSGEKKEIDISNTANRIGSTVLARIGIFKNRNDFRGYFLTSTIPESFHSLDPMSYVLCGLWTEEMIKQGECPTRDEVNKYYDPGQLLRFVYFKKESTESHGRKLFICRHDGDTIHEIRSYRGAVRGLGLNHKRSRLFLAEDEKELDKLRLNLLDFGLFPLVIEPLIK